MMDSCIVYTYGEGAVNALGIPEHTYTAGDEIPCGYKPTSTREANQDGQVVTANDELRVAIDTAISSTSRVRITKRHGVTLTDQELHEVIGEPSRGPSGLVVLLREVTEE